MGVLAPLAAVPIEPEPANSSVVASRSLAPCTHGAPGKKVKVKGKKKTCDDWAELGKCKSTVKNESFTVSSVCEQSCNACPAAPTGPTLVPCTDTNKKIKVGDQSGNKKCASWKKKVKGVCDSFVKGKSDTVSSVCAKSCATNTVTGRIKLEGKNGQGKKCKDWVKKG